MNRLTLAIVLSMIAMVITLYVCDIKDIIVTPLTQYGVTHWVFEVLAIFLVGRYATKRNTNRYYLAFVVCLVFLWAPLELPFDLPYVDLIKKQWERTAKGKKVWDLKREYAWEIIKELDPKLYTHYYRFNRTMEFVKDPRISPPHLLSWFGWKRLQTAYNYLELGGRRIKEMRGIMVEQYTGKRVEFSPEEPIEKETTLVEQPIIEPKPKPKKREEKSSYSKQWFFGSYEEDK